MTYDAPPSRRTPAAESSGIWRSLGKWSIGLALSLSLLALFSSLLLFQLTAEGSAKRTLRRSVATLTEIDPLIDRNFDDLRRRAENTGPDETVRLRGFPIDVPLAPSEVAAMSTMQLRDTLLDRSADVMYSRGAAPLRSTAAKDGDIGRFSIAGLTKHGLGFLRKRNHDILAVTTIVLAALCAVLALVLASMCRGYGRLTGVGMVVVAAAIPVVIGGIGARFYMRVATESDNEFVQREFLEIGQGLAWIPIRDGAAFTILGLLFLTVGYACAVWSDRRAASRLAATTA